ncbi:MAG: DUF3376 domain-containing protein [Alphaproteobacteria bacterium]|nr:DUF3376 domain-containing protein [Alphaproteobacteria bacterium]
MAEHNREVRRIAEVIAAAEPLVESEVHAILGPELLHPLTVQELTRCRTMANERAHLTAGYAYRGYQRLKLSGVVERVADLCARVLQDAPGGALTHRGLWQRSGVRDCASSRCMACHGVRRAHRRLGDAGAGHPVPARPRCRLPHPPASLRDPPSQPPLSACGEPGRGPRGRDGRAEVDALRADRQSPRRWSAEFYGQETRSLVERLLETLPPTPRRATLVAALSARMGLADLDALADDVFSMMTLNYLPQSLHLALTGAYVGFAFYDLVTLPVLRGTAIAEHNEVQVDRISPADPHSLRPQGIELKGRSLNAFGAFFNRGWREHDYLWGRLTAADRLMTMALQAAEPVIRVAEAEVRAARHGVFLAILEEERDRLNADPALVPGLLREVEEAFSDVRAGA